MNKFMEEKGVTLLILMVTIILLLILAGISITMGTDLVEKAKVETIETNMLTIKAKAKEYAENVDSLTWALDEEDAANNADELSTKESKNRAEFQDTYYLTLIEDQTTYSNYSGWYDENYTFYALSQEALELMGLGDLWEDSVEYAVRYPLEDGDTENLELDIIYINGIKYQDTTYYKLADLQEVL